MRRNYVRCQGVRPVLQQPWQPYDDWVLTSCLHLYVLSFSNYPFLCSSDILSHKNQTIQFKSMKINMMFGTSSLLTRLNWTFQAPRRTWRWYGRATTSSWSRVDSTRLSSGLGRGGPRGDMGVNSGDMVWWWRFVFFMYHQLSSYIHNISIVSIDMFIYIYYYILVCTLS